MQKTLYERVIKRICLDCYKNITGLGTVGLRHQDVGMANCEQCKKHTTITVLYPATDTDWVLSSLKK